MQTLVYLLKLFSCLALGALVSIAIGKKRLHTLANTSLEIVLYSLLFLMGVNTAQIPNIKQQLFTIGMDAFLATVLVVAGCIVSGFLLSLLFSHSSDHTSDEREKITWKRIKTPLSMIGMVFIGLVVSFYTPLFRWFESSYITYILYLMLFFVGMQMVQQEISLLPLLTSPMMILLPLSTIVGTYLGALAIPLMTQYTIRESMALVSGFGWYSLSGVLISSLGEPKLGAVSFLSNLFRETLSFVLIPLLGTLFSASFSPISIAGATSMDVTLPILKKSLGESIVPLAISHGIILTLLAPFLIPLWF